METLVQSPFWGIFSLLFFFAFFIGVVLWVMRPGTKKYYEHARRIPLEDDNE